MARVTGAKTNAGELLYFSATKDLSSITKATTSDVAITVSGVRYHDSDSNVIDMVVAAIPPSDWNDGLVVQSARVTDDDEITVRVSNVDAVNDIDAASGTWEFLVARF